MPDINPTTGGATKGLALRAAVILATTAVLTAADQTTKAWAFHSIGLGRAHGQPNDFLRFTCHMNRGTAWGFCSGGHWYGLPTVILVIGTAVGVLMALAAARVDTESTLGKLIARHVGGAPASAGAAPRPMLDAVAFALLVSGALGNALDRFQRGWVIDFVDVGIGATRWPTFNGADAYLVVGIYLVLTGALADLVPHPGEHRDDAPAANAPSPIRIFVGVAASAALAAAVMAVVGRACENSLAVNRAVISVLSYLGVVVVAILVYGYARMEMRRLRRTADGAPPPGAET